MGRCEIIFEVRKHQVKFHKKEKKIQTLPLNKNVKYTLEDEPVIYFRTKSKFQQKCCKNNGLFVLF